MRVGQVPEEQAELLAKIRGNEQFRGTMGGTLQLSLGRDYSIPDEVIPTVQNHLAAAYPYYVTKDMSTLVQHAADGLDEEDLWDASLAPTSCGFVRFEKPLVMIDVRNQKMLAHWLTWGPVEGGTMVTLWNDTRDPDDVVKLLRTQFGPLVDRIQGHWSLLGGTGMKRGSSLGPARIPVPETYAVRLEEEGITPTPFTSAERLVHALWLMLGQTIVDTREEHVRPKYTHQARKMNLPTMVTVIDLRRMEGVKREAGESHIEWQHRWVTRGHWRWQAYGAGRTERKRIWIHDFIKGPDDKPLVISQKVYALRR